MADLKMCISFNIEIGFSKQNKGYEILKIT